MKASITSITLTALLLIILCSAFFLTFTTKHNVVVVARTIEATDAELQQMSEEREGDELIYSELIYSSTGCELFIYKNCTSKNCDTLYYYYIN